MNIFFPLWTQSMCLFRPPFREIYIANWAFVFSWILLKCRINFPWKTILNLWLTLWKNVTLVGTFNQNKNSHREWLTLGFVKIRLLKKELSKSYSFCLFWETLSSDEISKGELWGTAIMQTLGLQAFAVTQVWNPEP